LTAPHLSTTEYAVLGVLAEGPSHGFAISKLFEPDAELGRVFKVRRPLVYRALERLVEAGHAEEVTTEKGDAGPNRVVHRITGSGRRLLRIWLAEPVRHVRDLRIDFLLKLALLRRAGRSPLALIRKQRRVLEATLQALSESETDDPVELWRRHSAGAAAAYLADLEARYS
jgi:DNA-binding PadR family transcriptional regulator